MNFRFECETHEEYVGILPSFGVAAGKCEHCDAIHGWDFQFGWLVWTLHFTFE